MGRTMTKTCTLEAAEREAIIKALRATRGHVTRSAEVLGISRQGLYEKLRKFNLDPKSYKAVGA